MNRSSLFERQRSKPDPEARLKAAHAAVDTLEKRLPKFSVPDPLSEKIEAWIKIIRRDLNAAAKKGSRDLKQSSKNLRSRMLEVGKKLPQAQRKSWELLTMKTTSAVQDYTRVAGAARGPRAKKVGGPVMFDHDDPIEHIRRVAGVRPLDEDARLARKRKQLVQSMMNQADQAVFVDTINQKEYDEIKKTLDKILGV